MLAAGQSRRFGGDKLLHPYAGKPLAAHVADTLQLLTFSERLAICPARDTAREALFRARGFEIVANPDPARGMGASLALAARRALALEADALLVCLADMPAVTAAHLRHLIGVEAEIVATEAAGTRMPPALFGRRHLPVLLALSGDQGARDLLRGAAVVPAPPALAKDVDEPSDLA